MNAPALPPTPQSYAERIAWMHEPVHLRCGLLPWFVVRWLEQALHSYFCSFERHLLALMELHQQGKLEPWPDAPDAVAHRREAKKYAMKFAPSAPTRGAGGSAALDAADVPMAALASDAVEVAEVAIEAAQMGGSAPGAAPSLGCMQAALPPALQHSTSRSRQLRPPQAEAWRPHARCRSSTFFRPAGALRENCVQIVPVS